MNIPRITLLAAWLIAPLSVLHAGDQPNFIVIFVDDLGYADISPFGKDRYDTPNLDRMAREGRKFTNFYVASSVCTPSRAVIMTGCYPIRVSMLYNETRPPLPHASVMWPGNPKGLNPNEVTIAEVLKERGYATACIGKWHLGDQPPFLPTRQGFDEFFGIPNGHDMGLSAKPFQLPPPITEAVFLPKRLTVSKRSPGIHRTLLTAEARQPRRKAVSVSLPSPGGPGRSKRKAAPA